MLLRSFACPSCNKHVTRYGEFAPSVQCPHCGTVVNQPAIAEVVMDEPDLIIPFKVSKDAFKETLVETLVAQEGAAGNVFTVINTDAIHGVYVPMYLYEGSYSADWQCSEKEESMDASQKAEWVKQNGNATGSFSFLCLANEGGKDVSEDMMKFISNYACEVSLMAPFAEESLNPKEEKQLLLPCNVESSRVWKKHGKAKMEQIAHDAALDQLAEKKVKKFKVTTSCTLTTDGKLVLVPFWVIYYKYNNKQYHFFMDGIGANKHSEFPLDEEEKAFVKKVKTAEIFYVLLCILIAAALIYFDKGWPSAIPFAFGLLCIPAEWIKKLIIKNMRKKNAERRKEGSLTLQQTALPLE